MQMLCCVVTNAAGTPGLLDELHKEMWLLFEVVQILVGGGWGSTKASSSVFRTKMLHVMLSFEQVLRKKVMLLLVT